jgi:hypothetical protein
VTNVTISIGAGAKPPKVPYEALQGLTSKPVELVEITSTVACTVWRVGSLMPTLKRVKARRSVVLGVAPGCVLSFESHSEAVGTATVRPIAAPPASPSAPFNFMERPANGF